MDGISGPRHSSQMAPRLKYLFMESLWFLLLCRHGQKREGKGKWKSLRLKQKKVKNISVLGN